MSEINPEMIILARDLRGMTQADLAKELSISQSALSKYEAGLIDVPQEQLELMGKVLGRPTHFFCWKERLYSASCLYHRKNRRISQSELRLIHATVNFLR